MASRITVSALAAACWRDETDNAESVIWFGDFNYRVGLGLEMAKDLVRRQDLGRLYENDQVCLGFLSADHVADPCSLQLNLQMVAGLAFPYYSEARINFMPTYKFDVGTDEYDSS